MEVRQEPSRTARFTGRSRRWLAVAGVLIMAGSVLPFEMTAGKSLPAESAEFCAFAMVGPALVVLGAPWTPRRGRLPFSGAIAVLVVFTGLGLLWRLPPVLDALARHPPLDVAELFSMLLAGTALWLQLAGSPSLPARLARPQRAAIAALAMWSAWAIAYVLGFANHAVVHAYDTGGGAPSVIMDQEIASGVVWAVAGACFIPLIYVAVLGWLRDSTAARTGRDETAGSTGAMPVVRGWGRPSR